jgi:phage replication-related protein YjqB (UPF0714/DUF867 family)
VSDTFGRIVYLVEHRQVVISDHGYDELAAEGILVGDVKAGVAKAIVVEDYPDYP